MNIAIIGASADRKKFGNKAVRAYKENTGYVVFPVNPKEASVEGLRCYVGVRDIKERLDAVSLYVPAKVSLALVSDFKAKKVPIAYVNPGAESAELLLALKDAGIEARTACSIRAIHRLPEEFP